MLHQQLSHLSKLTVATCALFVAATASADSLKLNTTAYSNGAGLGGGVYSAVPVSGTLDTSNYHASALYGVGANQGFGTFCLEYTEHFNAGSTYAYTSGWAATLGSGGAVAGQDPISVGTAWLYAQFAMGNLGGYNYSSTSSALALQLAFWFLEDETALIAGGTYGGNSPSYNYLANSFVSLALGEFGSLANVKADANGAYGVQVLNLTSVKNDSTVHHQSQLYFAGLPPPPSVPDASTTLALLGFGLATIIGLRRRLN